MYLYYFEERVSPWGVHLELCSILSEEQNLHYDEIGIPSASCSSDSIEKTVSYLWLQQHTTKDH